MSTYNDAGAPPSPFILLHGDSPDGHAHGGRDLPGPPLLNRKVQIARTAHPSTDRWVVLRTVRLFPTPLFEVGVLDGFGKPTAPSTTYPTHERARRAANRLYRAMTEEP